MDLNKKHAVAGGGLLAAGGVAYLLLADGDRPSDLGEAQDQVSEAAGSVTERVEAISESGELVVDPASGVLYSDPETGEMDDEVGDDPNPTFEQVNEALASAGASIDPTQYAPDVEGGSTAPSGGNVADAGDSQQWGSAGEQENDDLTERAATSNMSPDQKSMWDRFANRDNFNDDEPAEEEEEEDYQFSLPDDLHNSEKRIEQINSGETVGL